MVALLVALTIFWLPNRRERSLTGFVSCSKYKVLTSPTTTNKHIYTQARTHFWTHQPTHLHTSTSTLAHPTWPPTGNDRTAGHIYHNPVTSRNNYEYFYLKALFLKNTLAPSDTWRVNVCFKKVKEFARATSTNSSLLLPFLSFFVTVVSEINWRCRFSEPP